MLENLKVRQARYSVVATSLAACTSLYSSPPLEPGWTREQLPLLAEQCSSLRCPTTVSRDVPGIEIRTQVQHLRPHQIPGWEVSTAGRVLEWLSQEAIRGAGGLSSQSLIGLGTRDAVETRPDGWRIRCSLFWIEEQTIERVEGSDEITGSTPLAEGIHCDAFGVADSAGIRWRLRSGIAPDRDRLATLYDSLVAARSDMISTDPPAVMEHVDSTGAVVALFRLAKDAESAGPLGLRSRSRTITRSDGTLVARLHEGMAPVFDYAPDATAEERHIVRLFGLALALPVR